VQCKARGSKLDKLTILSETVEYIRVCNGNRVSRASLTPSPVKCGIHLLCRVHH
jgi:hypothetical protein